MGRLGVTVAPVTREDASRFELTAAQRGLMVTDVAAGGPSWGELVDADRGGPDIILEIEGKAVKSTAELRKALESHEAGRDREPPDLQRPGEDPAGGADQTGGVRRAGGQAERRLVGAGRHPSLRSG